MGGKHLPACAVMVAAALCSMAPELRAVAAPPQPSSEPTSVPIALVFDPGELDPYSATRLHDNLFAQLGPVLRQTGMQLIDAAEPGALALRVHVVSFDPERRDYEVQLEMAGDGRMSKLPIRCEACSERRLVSLVAESTALLLAPHDQAEQQAPPELARPKPPPVEPIDSPPPRKLGRLGISGAVSLGVGVLGIAAGTYLVVRKDQPITYLDAAYPETRIFWPAGAGTLAAGAVAAGIGATLLVVDLQRRNERRRVALQVTPTYVGINLLQRF